MEILFQKRKICIDRLWHNAKLRAIQTAEILCKEAGWNAKIEKCEGLVPNDPIDKIVARIKSIGSLEKESTLMMVGHLPYLQKLPDFLITGSGTIGRQCLISFRKFLSEFGQRRHAQFVKP